MSKTIYYACKYAPLELFAGYGATFSALDPLAESFSCAERCAHANLCGYAKAVLEQVEQSGIRALVLTHDDRLLRFGTELIYILCRWVKTTVVVLDHYLSK